MQDETNRRPDAEDATPPERKAGTTQDPLAEALRDLPRMRPIGADAGDEVTFRPPPPTVSRISGMVQGCGGLALTIIAGIMLLAAMGYGFYLWGPGLLLASGLVLLAGTLGVWRGQRVPVIASIAALIVAGVVGYFWQTFVMVAGRLVPLGQIGMFLGQMTGLIALLLGAALITNVASLFYWKRLWPSTARGLTLWVGGAVTLIVIALGLHFSQQQQRENWLDAHLTGWQTEASTETLTLGSNLNVTLGFTFTVLEEGDDDRYDVRVAELQAAVDAGAAVVRMAASGDMLLEAQEPRMFGDEDDEAGHAKALARVERQQEAEKRFMEAVEQTGVDVMLADYQYSLYLQVRAYEDEQGIPWDEFAQIQEERERYYARTYQPAYYEVLSQPSAYDDYSSVELPEEQDAAAVWAQQAERLAAAVREESPETQIGVSIALQDELDADVYARLLQSDAIDFVGFRVYQPGAFQVLDDLFAERGHPHDYGKQAWITETWYGACVAPQRSQSLDAKWLAATVAYAAQGGIDAVLASDLGCFVQEGGTLLGEAPSPDSRTDVWQRWHELVLTWQRP